MIRRRDKPDGLPFRVYERKGARVYSIGYKLPNGKWAFRYSCPADDAAQIAEHRRRAITEAAQIGAGVSATGATEDLIDAWFKAKDALGHTTDRMLGQVYDRRPVKKATAVR